MPTRARTYVQPARSVRIRPEARLTVKLERIARPVPQDGSVRMVRVTRKSALLVNTRSPGNMNALLVATTTSMPLGLGWARVPCARKAGEPPEEHRQHEKVARCVRQDSNAMETVSVMYVPRERLRRLDLAHALCVGVIRATVLREPTNVQRVPLDTSHPETPTRCERRARSASPDRRATAQAG